MHRFVILSSSWFEKPKKCILNFLNVAENQVTNQIVRILAFLMIGYYGQLLNY
jgi:hypothetical protein